MRHGTAVSTLANINRNADQRPAPYQGEDFIYWRDTGPKEEDAEPEFIDDPAAHSDLIRAAIFGIAPKHKAQG